MRDLFLTKAAAENDTLGVEAALTNSTSTNTDDFFSFNDDSIAEPTTNSTCMECLQYLEDKAHTLDSLHKYPTVKATFIKYNAAIPSSAPAERLFSYAGMVLMKNVAV